MSTTTTKPNQLKKTNALGINNIPDSATLITIAKACESFIRDVKGIRIVKFRDNNTRNALIEFISSRQCETVKETQLSIKLDGTEYELHYARSTINKYSSYTITASDDKLYVKYPEAVNESEVVKLLGDVRVSKPENAKNFFFATCRDIEHQCQLVRKFDRMQLGEGELSVKVAIDKTRKRLPYNKKVAATD